MSLRVVIVTAFDRHGYGLQFGLGLEKFGGQHLCAQIVSISFCAKWVRCSLA